jgi:hypothetical protein
LREHFSDFSEQIVVVDSVEQGSVLFFPMQPFEQFFGIELKIDGVAGRVHKIHVVFETSGTSPGGNQYIFELGHFSQIALFDFAKTFFAEFGKKCRDGFKAPFFDVLIQIDKRKLQFFRNGLSQLGFAGTHVTNQE